MPARDGTGPVGQGARTGRGLGNCQPSEQPVQPAGKSVWWNPPSWFGGVFRPGTGLRRRIRQGAGRGGRGR
jgi:hypothetical protein